MSQSVILFAWWDHLFDELAILSNDEGCPGAGSNLPCPLRGAGQGGWNRLHVGIG
jgi:hypothetical protein